MAVHAYSLAILLLLAGPAMSADHRAGIEFFEQRVRPVLIEHCYECHSDKATIPKGGLRLDSKSGLLQGGDSGPAIVPGHPAESLLVSALHWESFEMPPSGRLPNETVADVARWIEMGAPDPRSGQAASVQPQAMSIAEGRNFWSLRPPQLHRPPQTQNDRWPADDIDRFVLAKLEQHNLTPAPPTDRRTLLRRLHFDLIGLPPTYERALAFAADESPKALEQVVDSLLSSEHFGERWARYWLDLTRYADTGAQNRRFSYAFSYRDWLIGALNRDMPYDHFIRAQLAADQLDAGPPRDLAALGLIALGTNLPRPTDVPENIDDRIDVVTRTFLGLTVGCARCHDHKFDPILTRDYYALYGVFLNTELPLEPVSTGPLPIDSGSGDVHSFYKARLRERRASLDKFRRERLEEHKVELRSEDPLRRYLVAAFLTQGANNETLEQVSRQRDLNLYLLKRWHRYLANALAEDDPIFLAWKQLPKPKSGGLQLAGSVDWSGIEGLHPHVAAAFASAQPKSAAEFASVYAELLTANSRPHPFDDPAAESLRRVLWNPQAPANVPLEDFWWIQTEGDSNVLKALKWQYDGVFSDYAFRQAPPFAMVLRDAPQMQPAFVFVRGNQHDRGERTPARFLSVLTAPDALGFSEGSGRRELADAIASANNPLTARVYVNRVWQHLFGEGLVRTPSDFGTRGAAPTHPELIDYLASTFMQDGWSTKRLIRRIVLSQTYRQRSLMRAARAQDPDNYWISHANRERLDFESLRDSILAAAGQLRSEMGGAPFALGTTPATPRRTVYAYIERERVAGLLKNFDFSDPEQHTAQRHSTTVPQQALFMMNSPFVAEQSRHLAKRAFAAIGVREFDPHEAPSFRADRKADRWLQQIHRFALARDATADELALGHRFLAGKAAAAPATSSSALDGTASDAWSYGVGDVREEAGRVEDFRPFEVFTGTAWQASTILPAPVSGRAHLTRTGGAPGDNLRQAVVRRWTSPVQGPVDLGGKLEHRVSDIDGRFKHSNGIRGWVISSRSGILDSWTLYNESASTELGGIAVHRGETIDFVVDSLADYETDTFSWSPTIETNDGDAAGRRRWEAKKDFRGPVHRPLTIWEQYAQILLLTNEFVFVD